MIEVKNLVKEFAVTGKQKNEFASNKNYKKAVDDISFVCKPGRIFSLLGPNGAGKTTTLRIISTILKPTSGSVSVCGYNIQTESKQIRSKIGFLTGSTGLYERLTPNELVKFFADLNNIENSVFKKRKEELFNLLDMNEFANTRIGKLSTGMKQKVNIVRTIIHNPEVLVFDEPTASLDVITAKNIINLIRNCKEQNKTVIFSSHIMSEVEMLCDDLAIIHNGKILFNDNMQVFKAQMKADNITEEFIRIVEQN